jgi:hypothetical protein
MEHLPCLRSARRAVGISSIFLVFILIGLLFVRDHLIDFFYSRPELNTIILGIIIAGFIMCFRELARILKECRSLRNVADSFDTASVERMRDQLNGDSRGLVRQRCANILDLSSRTGSVTEIASLLGEMDAEYEESRSLVARYLLGVMILLGLIGTFWGLLSTVSGVKDVLLALQPEKIDDPLAFLAQFKTSISGMLGGLSTSFSTSLFGLGGSVLVGFVDVQVRKARSGLLADLDYFVAVYLLPAAAEASSQQEEAKVDGESISARQFEQLITKLLDRFDALGYRTQDLLEETRKSRESSERTSQALRDIFESEDRLVNRIVSIGLANLRFDSGEVLDGAAERPRQAQKRKEGS